MSNWLGDIMYECYGATEVGGVVATPQDWRAYPGTVGKLSRGREIRILDENGRQVPAGVEGMVYLQLSPGDEFTYKDDPEKTQAARRGNFATVGDIGYVNDAGYLFLLDRQVDVINCRGEHIFPAQIEAVAIAHPWVADCTAYGAPHPEFGALVRLAVQLETGLAKGPEAESILLKFLRTRLTGAHCPSGVDFVERVPRDPAGKLHRREVRDWFRDRAMMSSPATARSV
jgi:long-chain acyl-CoA synthetase